MRKSLIWTVTILALLYTGAWFASAHFVGRIPSIMARETDDMALSDISISGFPIHWNADLFGAMMSFRGGGFKAEAEQIAVGTRAIWPNYVELRTVSPVALAETGIKADLTAENGVARIEYALLGSNLPLSRVSVTADQISLLGHAAWQVETGPLSLVISPVGRDGMHELRGSVFDVTPAAAISLALDPKDRLADLITHLKIVLRLDFPGPIGLTATAPNDPTAARLEMFQLVWGDMVLIAAGDVTIDPQGLLDGRIELEITQWKSLIDLLGDHGVLETSHLLLLRRGLENSASGDVLDIPITIEGGQMHLGFVPLGPAPAWPVAPG